jgi:two-component system cell cycle response regulator
MKETALFYEPDQLFFREVSEYLIQKGWEVQRVHKQDEALQRVARSSYSIVLCHLEKTEGIDFINGLWGQMKNPSQILVVGPNDVDCAVQTMKCGARHYWPMPFQLTDFQKLFEQGQFSPNRSRFGFHREGTLLQIIKEIALTMELDGLANILVDSAIELTAADGGAILLLDEKSNMLVMKAVRGLSATEHTSEIFGLPEKEFYEILSKREPVLLHPDPPVFVSGGQKVESIIVTPTWWKDQALSELVMVKYQGSPDFTRDDFKVLSLLNEEIAGAVHNAIIHYKTKELTIKDDLTEAYNRRYFEQYLDEEFIRAKRYGSDVSLIFFDVDNLKEVNVKYGHLTGSKTLQEIAHRIILTVRGIDKVVRYGGDEFCIVLPETDTQGAYQVADRIRNTISMRPFRVTENVQVTLTGSIGIASFPAHATSKEDLVRQADRAMFIIKNQSKNAIAVAPPISN